MIVNRLDLISFHQNDLEIVLDEVIRLEFERELVLKILTKFDRKVNYFWKENLLVEEYLMKNAQLKLKKNEILYFLKYLMKNAQSNVMKNEIPYFLKSLMKKDLFQILKK